MDAKQVLKKLKIMRENGKKRKFTQSVDFILTLKNFDPKKAKVDAYVDLHHDVGRRIKVCALVGGELKDVCKKFCDTVIIKENFNAYKDKVAQKKLADSHDYFIAQGDVMKDVATYFGKVLGSRGKMPNPKAGCVVPANANIEQVVNKLQRLVRINTGQAPQIMCTIGKETQDDAIIADNIATIYNTALNLLPSQQNNVRAAFIKMTMTKAVKLEE